MGYDYKSGKKRVDDILSGKIEIVESGKLPSDDNFTFDNAYHSWVMAIFVDIRDSTSLMAKDDQEYVAKVCLLYTSRCV